MISLQEIQNLVEEEDQLDKNFLHLTANETLLSPQAQNVLNKSFYNRYLLEHADTRGDSPSRLNGFLFRGLNNVNKIEKSAKEVCKSLFGAKYVEFRCLSGLHAMFTTICALTKPGEKVMRFSTKDGGHFATQHLLKLLGREDCTYIVDPSTKNIDVEKTKAVFEREKPQLLYIDAMNYLFPFPLKELKKVVGDVPIIFDASHTLGLIGGGEFQNPLAEGADIIQANTHKTFFGPQKGIILSNNRELMDKISYSLTNGLVSSQHTCSSLSLFVALHESLVYGRSFARKVVENAQLFARLLEKEGFKILGAEHGYTKNHQFFIDITQLGSGPQILEKVLAANISVNRTVPFEHIDALRVGVQETTRRGFGENEYKKVAKWFRRIVLENESPENIKAEVLELVNSFQEIKFCDSNIVSENQPLVPVKRENDSNRWVDFQKEGDSCKINEEFFNEFKQLANVASGFDEQVDSSGNVSFLDEDKMFVTVSGSYIKDLKQKDFAEVLGYDNGLVRYKARSVPSSETLMHYLIYQKTDAQVVVHNHFFPTNEQIEKFGVKVISPKEYASVELAQAVAKACEKDKIVFVERHGLIFWGKSVQECSLLIQQFLGDMGEKILIGVKNAMEK